MKAIYPECTEWDPRTIKAVTLFREIAEKAAQEDWLVVFMSGLAIDAHFGYVTRQHGDVDLCASFETAQKIRTHLESLGHVVYEPEALKGECLKVDQAVPDMPLGAHADIHYFSHDEDGRVVIPLAGKELRFSGGIREISERKEFLGQTALFLKPEFLIEEKIGWEKQVGLTGQEEKNAKEIQKIRDLLSEE